MAAGTEPAGSAQELGFAQASFGGKNASADPPDWPRGPYTSRRFCPPPRQQEQLGHRGHKDDSLYRIRGLLRHGAEHLTERQVARLDVRLDTGDPNWSVTVAWQCY